MTWLLVAYAEIVVIIVICGGNNHSTRTAVHEAPQSSFTPYAVINFILFNILAFLALASHTRAMLSDPVSITTFC